MYAEPTPLWDFAYSIGPVTPRHASFCLHLQDAENGTNTCISRTYRKAASLEHGIEKPILPIFSSPHQSNAQVNETVWIDSGPHLLSFPSGTRVTGLAIKEGQVPCDDPVVVLGL